MSTYLDAYRLKYQLSSERWQALNHPYRQFEKTTVRRDKPDEDQMHKWPWRGFAFASDLGILAHLVKKPKLAGVGWLIALPYYVYSLLIQPSKDKRREESVYQLTANGLFPLLEAKFGTVIGKLAGAKLQEVSWQWTRWLRRVSPPVWKGAGGLVALAVLTPTVGDPLSRRVVQSFKNQRGDQC